MLKDFKSNISDRDIYISANTLIKQHGDAALEYSMIKLARMVEGGDRAGGVVWGRIQRAIIELQNTTPLYNSLLQ